jgi:hypothetical protein
MYGTRMVVISNTQDINCNLDGGNLETWNCIKEGSSAAQQLRINIFMGFLFFFEMLFAMYICMYNSEIESYYFATVEKAVYLDFCI